MDSTPVLALPKLAFTPIFTIHAALPLVFYIVLGIYAVFTAVLYYHWSSYADDVKVTTITSVAYLFITIPLIVTMASSALIF